MLTIMYNLFVNVLVKLSYLSLIVVKERMYDSAKDLQFIWDHLYGSTKINGLKFRFKMYRNSDWNLQINSGSGRNWQNSGKVVRQQ